MIDSVSIHDVDVEILAENDVKIWRDDVKTDMYHQTDTLTSCRRHFLGPVGFTEILVGYAMA